MKLQFRVEGATRLIHYGYAVPVSETFQTFEKAEEFIKENKDHWTGQPSIVVILAILQPLKMEELGRQLSFLEKAEADSRESAIRLPSKLEDIVAKKEALKKTIELEEKNISEVAKLLRQVGGQE